VFTSLANLVLLIDMQNPLMWNVVYAQEEKKDFRKFKTRNKEVEKQYGGEVLKHKGRILNLILME